MNRSLLAIVLFLGAIGAWLWSLGDALPRPRIADGGRV